MPVVTIKIAGSLSRVQRQKIAEEITATLERHALPDGRVLFDSYHCSRYNTNTRRLTEEMFRDVFERIGEHLADRS